MFAAMLRSRGTSLAFICMHWSTTRAFWIAHSTTSFDAPPFAYALRDSSMWRTTACHAAEAAFGATASGASGVCDIRRLCFPLWNATVSGWT